MAEPNSPKPVMQAVGERIKRASLEKLANFKVVCVPLLAYLSQWMERYCERERERERERNARYHSHRNAEDEQEKEVGHDESAPTCVRVMRAISRSVFAPNRHVGGVRAGFGIACAGLPYPNTLPGKTIRFPNPTQYPTEVRRN